MNALPNNPEQSNITFRETLLAGAALLVLLALFFAPAIIKGEALLPTDLIFDVDPLWRPLAPPEYTQPGNALLGDQTHQFYPWEVFTRRAFAQRTLPLWNPYTNGGQPFVGNAQSGIFNPFNVIGYLFPLSTSFLIEAMLRLFTAGIFTFLFARQMGIGKTGALLAMIVFAFSSPMTGWVGYPLASVIVWLPGLLFATERLLTGGSPLYLLLGGAMAGAQFLGGHPETSFPVMLVWGAYALFRMITVFTQSAPLAPPRGEQQAQIPPLGGWLGGLFLAPLLKLGGMAVIGVLLGSVQLFPFIESLLHSSALSARRAEAAHHQASWLQTLFLDWQSWGSIITSVLPQYFGTPLGNSYWYPYSNYLELITYAGVLPLALAIAALLYAIKTPRAPHRRLILFFALMGIFSMGVALHLPLFNAINQLPLFNISASGRFRLIYVLMIALLTGFGLELLMEKTSRLDKHTWRTLIAFALGSLLLIIVTYAGFAYFKEEFIRRGRAFVDARAGTPYLSRPIEYYYQEIEDRQEKKLALFLPTNLAMYIPLLTVGGYYILRRASKKLKLKATVTGWFILAMITADLFLVNMSFNPTTPPDQIYPTPDAIEVLQQTEGVFRVSGVGLILNPNSSMVFNLADVRGYDPVTPKRYHDLISRPEGYFPIHHHSLFITADSPLLDLLNVEYVLSDKPLGEKWELIYQGRGNIALYRNRQALPRAFMVYQAEIAANVDQSLARVLDTDFDFRKEVILEGRPPDWRQSERVSFPNQVDIIEYHPNRVSLTVSTPSEGVLVLTDTYMFGWQAHLDGQKIAIYPANHAFRGVIIPAGIHQVDFVYRPGWFWFGAGLSSLTLAALLICFAVLLLKKNAQ